MFNLCKTRYRKRHQPKQQKFTHTLSLFIIVQLTFGISQSYAFDLPKPLTLDDFITFDERQAKLGQLLFYDKILSGNQNISCGTCHHHSLGGSDGLSLGIGEGGNGVGTKRTPGIGADKIKKRIPRNAQALWNLGAKEFKFMFHDGRLSKSNLYENGYNSPAEEWLPKGLTNLLAAQAMFPVTSQFEMAGNPKENQIAGATHDRIDQVWPIISKRVRNIPEYGDMFISAFDHIENAADVTMVEIAEALSAFINVEWRSYDAPFDEFISGNNNALTSAQKRGLDLFYNKANCASCHSGQLFTDHAFHALALPPFGPGRTRRFDPFTRDVGRMGETDLLEDAYRFRTPSIRNVTLTAPYGHNGAYPTLESIVRHHLSPTASLLAWKPKQAHLPGVPWVSQIDFLVHDDKREMARIASHIDIKPLTLEDNEVDDLLSFLTALEGKTAHKLPLGRPYTVPSKLPVD